MILALEALLALLPQPTPAQQVKQLVLTAPTCARCTISRRAVAVFGKDAESQAAAPTGLGAAIPVGDRGYLGMSMTRGGPVAFTTSARSARRIGRVGSGPGEFLSVQVLSPWRGDSFLVHDGANGRLSVLTPSLSFARSMVLSIPSAESFVTLRNGYFVVSASLASRESVGYPLHLYDDTGKWLRSFGTDRPVLRPNQGFDLLRILTTDGHRLWSAMPQGRVVIEEWDTKTGKLVRTMRRRADFFPESERTVPLSPEHPPATGVTGLYYDRGLLWVLAVVPGRNWKSGLSKTPIPGETGELMYGIDDLDQVFDTIVEAFDAESGQLLASQRYPEHMSVFLAAGRMALHKVEGPDGEVVSEFMTFQLQGR